MPWRVATDPGFLSSLDELDDSDEMALVVERTVLRIMAAPLRAEPVPGTIVRVFRNAPTDPRLPAIVVFYTANDGVVTLLRAEPDSAGVAHS